MNYCKNNIRLIFFFVLTIFIFLNAAIEPIIIEDMRIIKFTDGDPTFFQMYASSIFLSCVALCAFTIIDFKGLKPKDWAVASVFGVIILLPMLINATSANILFTVATFFTYLASVTMKNQYGNKMPIITSTKLLDIAVDLSIVVGVTLVIFLWVPGSIVELNFSVNRVVLWPLAAAIGEEVIFRLFLFYIIIKLSKDNNPPFFITLLILVIPFVLWHVVGKSMDSGLLFAISDLYSMTVISTIVTILALKRGLFPAMLLHFLLNSLQGIITIS